MMGHVGAESHHSSIPSLRHSTTCAQGAGMEQPKTPISGSSCGSCQIPFPQRGPPLAYLRATPAPIPASSARPGTTFSRQHTSPRGDPASALPGPRRTPWLWPDQHGIPLFAEQFGSVRSHTHPTELSQPARPCNHLLRAAVVDRGARTAACPQIVPEGRLDGLAPVIPPVETDGPFMDG